MLFMSYYAKANNLGGSLWLPTFSISMLLMSINFQQKKVRSAVKVIKQIAITMASRFPLMQEIDEKMMMKTSILIEMIARSSTITNTNLSSYSFYKNQSYFEHFLVRENSISIFCWHIQQKTLNQRGSPSQGWLYTCQNLTVLQVYRQL